MTENQLEAYIKAYRGTVFRMAYSIVKNCEDSDDITQEAFVKLYRSKEDFAEEANVKAWLIRVTINLAKDVLKSSWRRRRADLDDNIPVESEEEGWLLDCVKRLKPEDGAVIYLYYYEGYSVNEIAALRRTTSAAVRTRLTRARKQLKAMLTSENGTKGRAYPLKEENL